jgi:excisionase family DNA binding protein
MSFDGGAYPVSAFSSLNAMAAGVQLTQVYPLLQQVSQQVASLAAEVAKAKMPQFPLSKSEFDRVGWLDAEGARKYLSMSKNTFEKYVYSGSIKKYLVGGKNLFKKTDLDLWVMTWEDKRLGFA